MTVLVISISLVLPMILWVVIDNVEPILDDWQNTSKATIYVNNSIPQEEFSAIESSLDSFDFILSKEVVYAKDAIKEFEESSGINNIEALLGENPLPDVIVLKIQNNVAFEDVKYALSSYEDNPNVDHVRFDIEWVQRLQAIVHTGNKILWIIVILVLLISMLIISNTIRLITANRKTEISVLDDIGATKGFICRPFLYSGFVTGVSSGILALIMSWVVLRVISPDLDKLLELYFAQYDLIYVSVLDKSLVVFLIGFFGWLSSLVTVRVFLSKYKPH